MITRDRIKRFLTSVKTTIKINNIFNKIYNFKIIIDIWPLNSALFKHFLRSSNIQHINNISDVVFGYRMSHTHHATWFFKNMSVSIRSILQWRIFYMNFTSKSNHFIVLRGLVWQCRIDTLASFSKMYHLRWGVIDRVSSILYAIRISPRNLIIRLFRAVFRFQAE